MFFFSLYFIFVLLCFSLIAGEIIDGSTPAIVWEDVTNELDLDIEVVEAEAASAEPIAGSGGAGAGAGDSGATGGAAAGATGAADDIYPIPSCYMFVMYCDVLWYL